MLFDKDSIQTYSSAFGLLPPDIELLGQVEFKKYKGNTYFSLFINYVNGNKRTNLSNTVCGDDENGNFNINPYYGKKVMTRLYDNDQYLDILVVVPKNRDGSILGFIICELGECRVKPNVWSVNLICTSKRTDLKVKASILLGAMMYCIKRKPQYEPKAILELAGGYSNIAGFIAYTKMGFNADIDLLLGKGICFHEVYNLPMTVDISSISFSEIKHRGSGGRTRVVTYSDDPTGLYNNSTKITQEELKREAAAANLSFQIDLYDKDPSLFDPRDDVDLIELIEKAKSILPNNTLPTLLAHVRSIPVNTPDTDQWYDPIEEGRDIEWTIDDSKEQIKEQLSLYTLKDMKDCKTGFERSLKSKTRRCIKKCPTGSSRNVTSGKCKKDKKTCPSGSSRKPSSGRCKKNVSRRA